MRTIKSIALNLLLFLLFLIISCVSEKNEPDIDNEVVLKIGSFEITKYEYEKNKERESEQPNYISEEEWIKSYISNSFFLADAYYRKYDTISAINKIVEYASISMLGRYKGYLWNKVEEPKLVISKREIKQVYRKQNKLYDLEYFMFPNKIVLNSILNNDTCISSEADFNKLIAKCHTSSVQYINAQLRYPFYELEPVKDQICSLKQGSIVRIPLKDGKILIAHLKSILEISQKTFSEEKENISFDLRRIKERQIIDDKQHYILNRANIVVNEKLADTILKELENDLYLGLSKTLLSDTILRFTFNNETYALSVAEFFDYYRYNPFMYVITNIESLYEILRDIVIEKYLYIECVELGITRENKFLLDKRDYTNRLILKAYYRNNFYYTKLSNRDLIDYYNTNKERFLQCKTCYVSVFTFKDKNTAYQSLGFLDKIVFQNGIIAPSDTSMMGLLSYQPNTIVEMKNNMYPIELVRNIFNSKINTPVGPVLIKNQESVFIKTKEEGQEIQPYELAKEEIRKQLIAENMEILKANKLRELTSNYSITINKIQKEK